jgi:hypothetical protein
MTTATTMPEDIGPGYIPERSGSSHPEPSSARWMIFSAEVLLHRAA